MAENMIERAAKAIWETWPERIHTPWDQRHEYMKDETRKEARRALLAALDLTDRVTIYEAGEALRRAEEAQDSGRLSNREDAVRVVLASLRSQITQGGSAS